MEQKYVLYTRTEYDDGDGYVDIMDEIAIGPFDSYQEAFEYNSKHSSDYRIVPFDSPEQK